MTDAARSGATKKLLIVAGNRKPTFLQRVAVAFAPSYELLYRGYDEVGHEVDGVVGMIMLWEASSSAMVVDTIRYHEVLAAIPIVIIGTIDPCDEIRRHLSALVTVSEGTTYVRINLANDESDEIPRLAAEVRSALTRKSKIDVEHARRYLFAVSEVRGIHSEHTQRDTEGPLYVLQAAAAARYKRASKAWEKLRSSLADLVSCSLSAPERQRFQSALARQARMTLADLPDMKTDPTHTIPGKWLLVDDNHSMWIHPLRCLLSNIDIAPIKTDIGKKEMVQLLFEFCQGAMTDETKLTGLLLSVHLHPQDAENTAKINSESDASSQSGILLLGKIRELDPVIPLIVLTGAKNPFIHHEIQSYGASYLQKPDSSAGGADFIKKLNSLAAGAGPEEALVRRQQRSLVRRLWNPILEFHAKSIGDKYVQYLRDALWLWRSIQYLKDDSAQSKLRIVDNSAQRVALRASITAMGLVAESILIKLAQSDLVAVERQSSYHQAGNLTTVIGNAINNLIYVYKLRHYAAHPDDVKFDYLFNQAKLLEKFFAICRAPERNLSRLL